MGGGAVFPLSQQAAGQPDHSAEQKQQVGQKEGQRLVDPAGPKGQGILPLHHRDGCRGQSAEKRTGGQAQDQSRQPALPTAEEPDNGPDWQTGRHQNVGPEHQLNRQRQTAVPVVVEHPPAVDRHQDGQKQIEARHPLHPAAFLERGLVAAAGREHINDLGPADGPGVGQPHHQKDEQKNRRRPKRRIGKEGPGGLVGPAVAGQQQGRDELGADRPQTNA